MNTRPMKTRLAIAFWMLIAITSGVTLLAIALLAMFGKIDEPTIELVMTGCFCIFALVASIKQLRLLD